ncbi:MAG: glycoside hydrolase family 16 protein [Acutalibacteraceae bacterium]|nr:glycoside hydrolase family 16 protein [Acutalibacteraceae bacterium]
MKILVKFTALILAVIMLTSCGSKSVSSDVDENLKIDVKMTQEESDVAQWLIGVYENLSTSLVTSSIKNSNDEITVALSNLGSSYKNKSVLNLVAKNIGTHGQADIYCVAVILSDNTIINDVLLEEEGKIVLQCIYDDETQYEIMDSYESYLTKIENTFEVVCKELSADTKNAKKTFLSISLITYSLLDETGKRIIYSSEEDVHHKLNGITVNDQEKENIISSTIAPQTKGDRTLVWNHEFEVQSTGELISHLTNTVDHMFARDSNLVTSMDQKNYFMDNGNLVLRITSDGNKNYTTARSVSTYEKMSFKYGYLEMRAKIPYQMCVWPGFWMKADKNLQKSKYGGEIDIFEVFSSVDTCVPNLHKWYGGSASEQLSNRGVITGQKKYVFEDKENLSDTYHVYGFEWTPDVMKFYVDDYCYFTVSIREEDDFSTAYPGMDCFHDFYYVCFNNWVYTEQQSWANSSLYVENNEDFGSADYVIDYIRLYQKNGEQIKLY